MGSTPVNVCQSRRGQQAEGPAAVLAIDTANPPHSVPQDEFPDYYFRISKSEHLTDLMVRVKIICENSGIKKRFFHINHEILGAHPDFNDPASLEARIEMTATEVPKLAALAAANAMVEWGHPATDITHIVFCTYSGARTPSADLRLALLLGLRPTVCRTALSLHGCFGGVQALHLAKDIAENDAGGRVLVVCFEISLISYCGPTAGCVDSVLGLALFGDGASAVIVGAGPFVAGTERPLLEAVCATQATILMTEDAITTQRVF